MFDSATGGTPAQTRFIRRPYQFLFWIRFVVGMFRLWWFNRRAAKARARRLAEG